MGGREVSVGCGDYAATLNDKTALYPRPEEAQGAVSKDEEARSAVSKDEAEAGMAAMSEKFKAMGEQVYVDAEKVKASNRVL
jgi:phosphomethylpyrimidine synthase